jgi:hypothetical protein
MGEAQAAGRASGFQEYTVTRVKWWASKQWQNNYKHFILIGSTII